MVEVFVANSRSVTSPWPTQHRHATFLFAARKIISSGRNNGGGDRRSSLTFAQRVWSGPLPHQANHLVHRHRLYRRLRHRRHRLCGAESHQGMARRAEGPRRRAQRQQFWRLVRFADFWLDRRSLWPQDGPDSRQFFVRRAHLRRCLFDQSHRIVMAALLGRSRHRRSYSQCGSH